MYYNNLVDNYIINNIVVRIFYLIVSTYYVLIKIFQFFPLKSVFF